MAKKKIDKEAERTPSSPGRIVSIFKNETVHFVIGLMLVIFSVYLLLAFSSFFFTGAADQSIIDSGNSADLAAVNNNVKNYAGSRGAQLASYLINDCFGISSFFILVFLAVAGLKLMRVRIVRLWKWFIGCTLLLIWFSVFFGFALMDHYQEPLAGFAGGSSRSMDDPADNGSLFLYLHKCTDDNLVAQTFCSEFPQTSEERRGKRDSRRRNTGVHDLATAGSGVQSETYL